VEDRLRWLAPDLEAKIASREVAVHPAEVLGLRHNRQLRLVILDVRSEADFNLFHLVDAIHVPPADLTQARVRRLPQNAVKVVISNDEAGAVQAWKRLVAEGMVNVYYMAGGINLRLDIYKDGDAEARPKESGDDRLRHPFALARGAHSPFADPDRRTAPRRAFEKKVKGLALAEPPKGGCGG
jgi:rhodanese-related sulfurtransferase